MRLKFHWPAHARCCTRPSCVNSPVPLLSDPSAAEPVISTTSNAIAEAVPPVRRRRSVAAPVASMFVGTNHDWLPPAETSLEPSALPFTYGINTVYPVPGAALTRRT